MKSLAEFNKNHLNKILFNQTLKINIKYCGKYFKIPQNKQINRHMMPNGFIFALCISILKNHVFMLKY